MPFVYLSELDCVMVRITKSASTSVLRSGFGIDDFETLRGELELPEAWASKFRFAFVRNPFDRLVSAWQMFQRHPLATEIQFDAASLTLKKVIEVVGDATVDIYGDDYWCKLKRHAIPVCHPHYRIDEADFIGRFERLESDWRQLCERLLIECRPLERLKNSGRNSHYSSFYDRETRALASKVFKDDLERFGYRFEVQSDGQNDRGFSAAG